MGVYKTILYTILAMLLGHFFKDEIVKYYEFVFPSFFGLAIFNIAYKKYKMYEKRVLISSKFDILGQTITLLIGIIVSTLILYYWIPDSYWHWVFLTGAGTAVISGLFYEKTIQLYENEGVLTIAYATKGKYELKKIDSFELAEGILRVNSEERSIEVYNVSMKKENTKKLLHYLSEFQRYGK